MSKLGELISIVWLKARFGACKLAPRCFPTGLAIIQDDCGPSGSDAALRPFPMWLPTVHTDNLGLSSSISVRLLLSHRTGETGEILGSLGKFL